MSKKILASQEAITQTAKALSYRFVLTVTIMLVACIVGMVVLLGSISDLREDGEALNTAGRQRALVMAIAYYADEIAAAHDDGQRNAVIQKLHRAKERLDFGFAFLTSGHSGDRIPSHIASYYANLRNGDSGLADKFLRQVDAVVLGRPKGEILVEDVVNALDQGVFLYQRDYEQEWNSLRATIIIVVSLLVILLLLIYALVLRPMQEIVKTQAMRMALFAKAVEQSGSMVLVTDPNGIITYANARAGKDLGYDPQMLIGQHTRIFNSGKTARGVYQSMWKTIKSGQTWQGEFLNQRHNGETFWVQATISPIRDVRGEIEGYMSIEQDISEFKKALLENEEVREQLLTAIEAVDDGFALFDKSERLTLWNSRFQMMFDGVQDLIRPGVPLRELIEQGAYRGQYGDLPNIETYVEQRLKSFREADGETEVHLANGSWLLGTDRKTADGGRVMLRTDISKMKMVEDELRLAKQQADMANQSKSAFLSSMSHELRTPLNAILGFAQMMQIMPNESLGKQQERCVNHILKGGKHLLDLINEVLDLAKIEAGKAEMSIEPVDVNGIIRECLSLLEKSADDRGLTVSPPADINQRLMVRADTTRCKQVLLNLLSNAVKYNREHGKITVRTDIIKTSTLRVTVTDSGNGIPLERQGDVFKPFNRLGAETSEIEGTGIGLSITKQLMRLMGGAIGFSSEPGVGSSFHVDFVLEADGGTYQSTDEPDGLSAIRGSYADLQGRVLCVEDNPANMSLLEMVFSAMPMVDMIPARSGEEGLDLALADPPDLILMDINLPGMDGFDALAALRANGLTCAVPVVAMTANAANGMLSRGLKAGFDRVLIKPMVVPDLLAIIESYLQEQTHETNPQPPAQQQAVDC